MFWRVDDIIKVSWAHWNGVFDDEFDADDDLECVPKLYVADAGSGDVELTYLGHIQRESLVPEVSHAMSTIVVCLLIFFIYDSYDCRSLSRLGV